jgi:hypothetical protein
MVTSAADVGMEHLADRDEIEKLAQPARLIHQQVARQGCQRPPQPLPERNAKALLGAVEDRRREMSAKCFPQGDFAHVPISFQRRWQGRTKLDDMVVQKRRARFQRAGHTGDIHLREQIAR